MKSFCLTLIAIGLLVSGYLLWRHFALADLSVQTGTDFCSVVFGTSCDDALQGPLAVQLGLPLAGWGLIYYVTLAALLLLGWALGETFRFEAMTAALLLALAAALGSITLLIVMLTDLSPFCPLCAVVHTSNLLLLFPLKRLTGRTTRQLMRSLLATAKYVLSGKTDDPVAARWKLVGFLAVALVAVVSYQWVFVEVQLHAQAPFNPQQAIVLFEATPQQEIPITDDDPRLGPADAPVRMVIFADFQCPGCTQLAQMVPGLATQFQKTLQIVFKHYPLDSDCNPMVKMKLHPKACNIAKLAEAAKQQGKFWAFHDEMFMTGSKKITTPTSMAEHLGLDLDQVETYLSGGTALDKIREDINTGIRIGVDGTPSVFINGRRVYDTRLQTMQFLITREISMHKKELK